MKYTGDLYGKIGRSYLKLQQTSDDVDKTEELLKMAIDRIKELQLENKQLRYSLQYNPFQLIHKSTTPSQIEPGKKIPDNE